MISRLFYHAFWNFYDALGAFTLTGLAALVPMVVVLHGAYWLANVEAVWAPWAGGAVLGAGCFAVLTAVLAASMGLAERGARDQVARMHHAWAAVKSLWGRMAWLMFLVAGALAVCAANVAFYVRLGETGPLWRWGALALSLLFVWGGIGVGCLALPVLSQGGMDPAWLGLRGTLKRALMLLGVLPGLWLGALITWLVLLALLVVSVAGLIYAMPLLAVFGCTAHWLTEQHVEFLRAAREELGSGRTISDYRRRALEMAVEWEARRPARTFREILRPWEA